MNKADCPSGCGWASPDQLKVCIEQKTIKRESPNKLLEIISKISHSDSTLNDLQTQNGTEPALGLQPVSPLYTDFGLASLHNCLSQFLIINIFVYTCTYPNNSAFLDSPD